MPPCTCIRGYPLRGERSCYGNVDDQCPTHGFEAWLKSLDAPVSTEGLPTEEEPDELLLRGDEDSQEP